MNIDAPLAEPGTTITIDDTTPADVVVTVNAEGDVSCRPDPLVVSAPDKTIVFRIASAGWRFTDRQAVVVVKPGTDFPQGSQTLPGGRTATLLDRDLNAGAYAYTVNVFEPSTGRRRSVDPTIENQPR